MAATVATHPPGDWTSYQAHLRSPTFWSPLLDRVGALEHIGVVGAQFAEPAGTYPVFICGPVLVKLYTRLADGQVGFEIERAVLEALAEASWPTARLLGAGELELSGSRYWYILVSRLLGEPLSATQRLGRHERFAFASSSAYWSGSCMPSTSRRRCSSAKAPTPISSSGNVRSFGSGSLAGTR